MRPRISIRGSVRPSVCPSVRPCVRVSVRPSVRYARLKNAGNQRIFNVFSTYDIPEPSRSKRESIPSQTQIIRGSVRPSVCPSVRMSVRPSVRNAFSKTVGNELIFNNRPSWEIARPSLVTLAPPPSCHTTTTTNVPTADHWGRIVGLLALFFFTHISLFSFDTSVPTKYGLCLRPAHYGSETGYSRPKPPFSK